MPSSPQHPAPMPKNLSGTEAEDLALYREKFRRRLPESMEELHGPIQGVTASAPLVIGNSDNRCRRRWGDRSVDGPDSRRPCTLDDEGGRQAGSPVRAGLRADR
ncbi:hypothetical protein DDW44_23745 [Streptomyces tirandamycinicus]|uniref:Uncharacterized protein n=1 Tax=Streptomyces tirandamycinicus TaxID=2174846 RepID=A0A2S1SYE5_9ACTN|nr:hypothetical protein DDW44_23745 [Streptomyces tirandamycinicus]